MFGQLRQNLQYIMIKVKKQAEHMTTVLREHIEKSAHGRPDRVVAAALAALVREYQGSETTERTKEYW